MHVASDGFHNTAWLEHRNHSSYLSFAQHCGTIFFFFLRKLNLKAIVIFSLFYFSFFFSFFSFFFFLTETAFVLTQDNKKN